MRSPQTIDQEQVEKLRDILDANRDKRVVVIGTTCTGKSTFARFLPGAVDMDTVLFPQLTQEERAFVCQTPWTRGIGETMNRLAKEQVRVVPGKPVFGTVVFESDFVVHLVASIELLRERTEKRGVSIADALNMHEWIRKEVYASGIPFLQFFVG